jgi:uncharacterized protein (TIRG00374 family)
MKKDPAKTSQIGESWHFRTFIISVILSIIGYLLVTAWVGWHEVLQAVFLVGFKGIIIALILSLFNYSLRFLRWQGYLKVLKAHLNWVTSLWIYMSGFALTTTPGKSGEAIRSFFLKDYGMPYRESLGAFFSERASDLIAVLFLSAFGLWHYWEAKPIIIIVGFVVASIIFIVQQRSWLLKLEKMAKRLLPDRFAHLVEFGIEMVLAFRKCFSVRLLLYGSFLGIIAWAAEGVALYYLLLLMNIDIGLGTTIFIYAFSLLIGAISFMPGGLGGAEVTMIKLLTLYEVPLSMAVAVTIIIRLTTLWFSVVLGLIALIKTD